MREVLLGGLLSALLGVSSPSANAAVIRMSSPACGATAIEIGTGSCSVPGAATVEVTFALETAEILNGYELEIRWDPSELDLVSATPLFPSSGTPEPFLVEPSDPADSRALALSLIAASTETLFRLTFDVDADIDMSGRDLWWFANGNGLSPGTVVLENPEGAGLDFRRELAVPALGGGHRVLLMLTLWACGAAVVTWRRRKKECLAGSAA